ncbi:MAG: FkbM family methyltransferase [Halioglobus sp.]
MTVETTVLLDIPGLDLPLRLQIHGSADQVVSAGLRDNQIWEPFETSLFVDLLKPGDVVVDVGANLGYFSIIAGALIGGAGRVFAFEPDPDNYALVLANIALNDFGDRVAAEPAGLSDQDQDGRLYLSEDNLGDHRIFPGADARNSCEIKLLNGSEFLGTRVSRVDFLKVDTQGSEYAVLAGLMSLLTALPRIPQILVELTPFSLRQAGSSGRQLIELLNQLNQPFWIVDHVEHRLVASTAEDLARWCDNVDGCTGDEGFMNILVGSGLESTHN